MPTKQFSLPDDSSSTIEISWSGYFKQLAVSIGGNTVLEFSDRNELKRG